MVQVVKEGNLFSLCFRKKIGRSDNNIQVSVDPIIKKITDAGSNRFVELELMMTVESCHLAKVFNDYISFVLPCGRSVNVRGVEVLTTRVDEGELHVGALMEIE